MRFVAPAKAVREHIYTKTRGADMMHNTSTRACEICKKAAMYTVKINGVHVCEGCTNYTWALTLPDARRSLYAGRAVTLDGSPAKIIGFLQDFATVAAVGPGSGSPVPAFEFSWLTVARAVRAGGWFCCPPGYLPRIPRPQQPPYLPAIAPSGFCSSNRRDCPCDRLSACPNL